jgi:enoyl-CoA hydratase
MDSPSDSPTWPLLCGMAKARLYLLTSRKISGREAERVGLVSEAVPAARVLDRALACADELAGRPALAIELTRRALNHWLRLAMAVFEASLGYEVLTAADPEFRQRVANPRGH